MFQLGWNQQQQQQQRQQQQQQQQQQQDNLAMTLWNNFNNVYITAI